MMMPNVSGIGLATATGNRSEAGSVKGRNSSFGFDLMLAGMKTSAESVGAVEKEPVARASLKTDSKTGSGKQDTQNAAVRTQAEQRSASVDSKTKVKDNSEIGTEDEIRDESLGAGNEEADSKEVLDQIAALVNVISGLIMDKLDLNADDFNKLLEELNMTALDLLDSQKLQEFVLAGSNQDNILALLTDEKLSALMMDLSQQIDSLKAEAGLSEDIGIDQLKELIAAGQEQIMSEKEVNSRLEDTLSTQDDIAAGQENDYASGNGKTADIKDISPADAQAIETESVQSSQVSEDNAANDKNDSGNQEQNAFQTFVDNMVNSINSDTALTGENQEMAAQLREIAYQIIDKVRVLIKPDQTSLEISLSPESLGKVRLTVESRAGLMTARFEVENQISKEAIESQLNALKETLNQQGIKVEAIEVTVAAYTFDQNGQFSGQNQSEADKGNSGRHITLEEAMAMTDDLPEDAGVSVTDGLLANQIN